MHVFKREDAISWITLAIVLVVLFCFFSSGQFSLIFTLSGTVQTFGFVLIALKIHKSRSVVGLSRETFLCYSIVFFLRSILFMLFQGYLPNDSTGNFIFKIQQIANLALSGYIVYCTFTLYKTSYNKDLDIIKCYYLIVPAAILAILFHSNLNRSLMADYTWAFTQYLQTIAILSQFILFSKKGGEIESYTSNFVASQAISRLLSIIFWIFTYSELNQSNPNKTYALLAEYSGTWFIISQFIHLIIMADFMYYWVRSIRKGEGIELPTYI